MDGSLTGPNQGFMVDEATQFCGDFSSRPQMCVAKSSCTSRGHVAYLLQWFAGMWLWSLCRTASYALESWNFLLFLHSQFRRKSALSLSPKTADITPHLLRNLSWIPCMVNSCDSNPRNAPSLLFKVTQSCLIHNHRPWKEFIRICLIFRQQLSSNLFLETFRSNVRRLTSSKSCVQVSAIVFLQDLVFKCQLSCFLRILCSSVCCRVSLGSCVQVLAIVFLQDLASKCLLSCFLRILCSGVSYRVSSGSCAQVSAVMLP
jgi:hypothetical protein